MTLANMDRKMKPETIARRARERREERIRHCLSRTADYFAMAVKSADAEDKAYWTEGAAYLEDEYRTLTGAALSLVSPATPKGE